MPPPEILIVEDDESLAVSLAKVLESEDFRVTVARTGDEGCRRVAEDGDSISLVITDLRLPGASGIDLVAHAKEKHPHLPVILVTAFGTAETAIEATKRGAFDYILKPFEMPEILDLVDRALKQACLARDTVRLTDGTAGTDAAGDAMVGSSRPMQDLYKAIGRVAANKANVLIRGETGSGKELVARAIHQYGPRKEKPFIAVNCAAIPETLLESELFGHERGAFTGADFRRVGRFEQADGGTLFLDEIGDMPMTVQAKLLRVLQDRAIQRLGGKELIPVDVRAIFATHQPLEAMIRDRRFREDLFYRVNALELHVPALRDRPEDIPALVRYFLARHGGESGQQIPRLQSEALDRLRVHPWPGNVRQLENTLRKLVLQARGYVITVENVDALLAQSESPEGASIAQRVAALLEEAQTFETGDLHARVVNEAEAELMRQAMQRSGGNIAQVARWLGISRVTLREKLKQYGLYTPK